jgi:hypothetical protein
VVPLEKVWSLNIRTLQTGDRAALALALTDPPNAWSSTKQYSQTSPSAAPKHSKESYSTQQVTSFQGEGNSSPIPIIDNFVMNLISGERHDEFDHLKLDQFQGIAKGSSLRAWSVLRAHQYPVNLKGGELIESSDDGKWTITFQVNRYRYCERIKRHHRSNNIMIVVTVDVSISLLIPNSRAYPNQPQIGQPQIEGFNLVVGGDWRQRCHDPECRGYDFPKRPIPKDVVDELRTFFKSRLSARFTPE